MNKKRRKESKEDVETAERSAVPNKGVLYSVEDTPSWYLCVCLGFQHFLTAAGSLVSIPLLLRVHFCLDDDYVGISELIGTIFVVSGVATLLQTTVGVRLPIVQGGTASFLVPTIAIMAQDKWSCEYTEAREQYGPTVNFTAVGLPEVGSDGHRELWMKRLREVQGAIMVASVFQVLAGFSGMVGLALRFIGPLSIAPTIAMIGLSLFVTAARMASAHWWIALTTMFLITLFSQYMGKINVPCCLYKNGHCRRSGLPIFTLFPVLLAMALAWAICAILTVTNVLPENQGEWGYYARTDIKSYVLEKSRWFRFPYPGQWGLPTVSLASVLGMLAGVIASVVESVGDYFACARIAGAPPPPNHAVNRGIGIEGIACILAGAWGSGNATTSYSHNTGTIAITRVGSRRVIQVAGIIMLIVGCIGKFGAMFATIPDPVVGGMFMVTFGMVTAVGLSNLQFVQLNSPRNLFILGISIFFGLSLPVWMSQNENNGAINTGNEVVDQIFSVLLSTNMFVAGTIGFVLDNTIPGTVEERGLLSMRRSSCSDTVTPDASRLHIYDLPLIQPVVNKTAIFRHIPCCPSLPKSLADYISSSSEINRTEGTNEDGNKSLTDELDAHL